MSGLRSSWSTFWAMVRKELILIARYPVNFIASFGQVFLIVAIFTLGSKTFSVSQVGPGAGHSGEQDFHQRSEFPSGPGIKRFREPGWGGYLWFHPVHVPQRHDVDDRLQCAP